MQSAPRSSEQEDSLIEQPNADRRLLYVKLNSSISSLYNMFIPFFRFIANLDCTAIMALVYTAPEGQAKALRDSIYNHLAFKASILATISVSG